MADNYVIQLKNAQKFFLTYDQEKLIRKFRLKADESFLYVTMFATPYRLCRHTGNLERFKEGWEDANTFGEVMTLLDILCDSKPDRCLAGKWNGMQNFGLMFHQNLLEEAKDPFASRIDQEPDYLHRAAKALGAEIISGGDMGYAFELFDGLKIGLLFWHGDDEFLPRVRYLWDENAKQYIRYETMYYAVALLRQRIAEVG